jgi:ribonuclease VapC
MIIDSSVIVAILRREPEADAFAEAMDQAPTRRVSAVNYVEAAVIIDSRRDLIVSRALEDLLRQSQTMIEAVTLEQAKLAREIYSQYGKGRHRAGLNLGDCFAYALAKEKGEPLLFKGNDFRKTDVEVAEY